MIRTPVLVVPGGSGGAVASSILTGEYPLIPRCSEKRENKRVRGRVIFVGAFASAGHDGTVGGITLACRTLLAAPVAQQVDWLLIDSTAPSNLSRTMLQKCVPASQRLGRVIRHLLKKEASRIIIFSAHGGSFYEKGLMVMLGSLFGLSVIFCPRSGFLLTELQRNRIQAAWARRVFGCSDVVICQSEYWRSFYSQFTQSPERLAVVQNWVDTSLIIPGSVDKRYPIITVLFMSWVVIEKGIIELIQATSQLITQGYEFNVLVCGGGEALDDAKVLARQHGLSNVTFQGWVGGDQKIEILQRVHLCVLPSYTEGLSNMMLEAMASGLPLICTDVGAARDVVTDGVDGLLIPARSTEALKDAMAKLLSDAPLREMLGKAARSRIENGNSISVGTERFLSLALGSEFAAIRHSHLESD